MWIAGNPWSRVNALLLRQVNDAPSLTASFWVALLVPFVLIGVAAARGSTIARPRLFLFPLIALCVSAMSFIYGWLARAIAGGEPLASGFLPMSVALVLGLVTAFGPFVIHIACCVIGAGDPSPSLLSNETEFR